MAHVIWTEPAIEDLDEIADYISLDKPDAARRLIQRVFERVGQLADHPNSGSVPSELTGTPYRHLVVPPLRIFYRPQKDIVYIVHVMRGERRFRENELQEGDPG